jgi:hypothetical protein
MAAGVVRLRTRPERLREDEAAKVRQAVLALEAELPLPPRAMGEIIAAIDRQTASTNGWTFVMLSPAENAHVVDWLAQNSTRPQLAMRLWAHLFLHLRRDTGEIVQTRDEIAEALGVHPEDVSRIMTELSGIGAVLRHRHRVRGMRGPGPIIYRMSPKIGTHLTGKARDEAQAKAPPLLTLIKNAAE